LREHRAVLDDPDAGELFEDPALCRVVSELGLSGVEPLVHYDDAFELCDIGARIERQLFDQRQERSGTVRSWCGQWPLSRLIARLGLAHKARLLLHCNLSSFVWNGGFGAFLTQNDRRFAR